MEIKDIEYLAFCDAVKLDWQFVQNIESKSIINGKETKTYHKLHELLSPDKFMREYKDINGNITRTEKVYKSEWDLKNKAGTVMNYLEHVNDNNGSFLKNWEARRAVKN